MIVKVLIILGALFLLAIVGVAALYLYCVLYEKFVRPYPVPDIPEGMRTPPAPAAAAPVKDPAGPANAG